MRGTRLRGSAMVIGVALAACLPAVVHADPVAPDAVLTPARSARGDTVDAAPVKAAVQAFHDALAAGDSARALSLLHPEVRVFEGGHAETLSEYRSGHLGADMAFSSAVRRELLSESVTGGGDWALYLSEYRMDGEFRGEPVEARGTETMVLVRTADGWRIRHVHWSSS